MICCLGTIANAINLIVFLKQGFEDTVNISLFGLAVSDGGCLLTQLWVNIGQTPHLEKLGAPVMWAEIAYVTGSIPYLCFTRISSLIVSYITFERCLCIVSPFKVKSILSSKVTTSVIVSIFLVMFAVNAMAFTVNLIIWQYDSTTNRTLLRNVLADNRAEVESIIYSFNNFFGYFSFLSIILFTVTLVTVLNSKARWRKKTAAMSLAASTTRDRKVIKMVVTISTIFILCYFPKTLVYFAIMVNPEFDMHGVYHNVIMMAISLTFCFETFNCSINILIYRNMSSRYRQILDAMFPVPFRSGKK